MTTLKQVVKNKYFALGVASNLLTEWGRGVLVPPNAPIKPDPPIETPPEIDNTTSRWRPHIKSNWRSSSVTVSVEGSNGLESRKIDFSYVATVVGGIGGAGFKLADDRGYFEYASGQGGQYGKGGDGNSFVAPVLEKYKIGVSGDMLELSRTVGERTDARAIIVDTITGEYNVFVPEYFWGSGTKIYLKPNMRLYLFGGDGENDDQDNKYWTCAFGVAGVGEAIGFEFDESILDTGITSVEIINNQNAYMSTQSVNIRIYDTDEVRIGAGSLLCEGGRACTINVKGSNWNKMYACAGGGGGAGISMNDEYFRSREIINAYSDNSTNSYNLDTSYVNMSQSASVVLNDVKGYNFASGSMGLRLNIDLTGDIKSKEQTFSYFSDITLSLPVNVVVTLYSGEYFVIKFTKTIENIVTTSFSTSIKVDLSAELSSKKLDKNSVIKSVETTVNTDIDTIIYTGGLQVSLVSFADESLVADSNINTKEISFSGESSDIKYDEFVVIEPPSYGVRSLNIDDNVGYMETSDIENTKIETKSPDDGLGYEDFLLIERGIKNV